MNKLMLILLLGAGVFSMSSCHKDWVCECTDNNNDTELHTIPNASLSDAKKTCDDYEYSIGGAYQNCSIEQ